MRHILILASLLLWPQQPQQPCQLRYKFEMGVQMPKDVKGTTSLTLYFKPPFDRPPTCIVDFGEAQFSTVNAGYAVLGGRQNSRIDFHCEERKP